MSSPYELAKTLCAAQHILNEIDTSTIGEIDTNRIKQLLVKLEQGVAYLEKLHGKCDKNILDER